jgi:hypothetical protein
VSGPGGGQYILDRYTFGTGGVNDRKDVNLLNLLGEPARVLVVISNTASGGGSLYYQATLMLDDGSEVQAGIITLDPSGTFRNLYNDDVRTTGFTLWGSASNVIATVVASRGYHPLESHIKLPQYLTNATNGGLGQPGRHEVINR